MIQQISVRCLPEQWNKEMWRGKNQYTRLIFFHDIRSCWHVGNIKFEQYLLIIAMQNNSLLCLCWHLQQSFSCSPRAFRLLVVKNLCMTLEIAISHNLGNSIVFFFIYSAVWRNLRLFFLLLGWIMRCGCINKQI